MTKRKKKTDRFGTVLFGIVAIIGVVLYFKAQPVTRIGMVHDYVFRFATEACEKHSGLHYVVSVKTEFAGLSESYPCESRYKIRCQDQTLLTWDDGTKFCFISHSQLEESMQEPL